MPRTDKPETETRRVTVDDPELSDATNQRLTEEVRDVIGADRVTVPSGRAHPSRGDRPDGSPLLSFASSNWLMIMIALFACLVIGGIIAATTGSWWFVALAIVVDMVGLFTCATVVVRMTAVTERPDPTLVAAMEEEGVVNPEEHFTRLVDEFTEDHGAGYDRGAVDRTTAVEDDAAKAAAEQRSATTPTGGPSRSVGPGSSD